MCATAFVLLEDTLAEARDSQRIGDMAAMRRALELYYIDHGTYPEVAFANSAVAMWGELKGELQPYISQLPIDPLNDPSRRVEETGAFNYSYRSLRDGNDYVLIFRLEQPAASHMHSHADVGITTTHGTFTFFDLTGVEGIFSLSAP